MPKRDIEDDIRALLVRLNADLEWKLEDKMGVDNYTVFLLVVALTVHVYIRGLPTRVVVVWPKGQVKYRGHRRLGQ